MNENKTLCIPTLIACNDGYELSADKTKCLPTIWMVPFPFLLVCGCFCLIVLAGKIKDWHHSLVFANLSGFFGIIELPFIIVYFIVSFSIVKWIIGLIAFLSIIPYIVSNIWMFFIFRKKTRNDKEFRNWSRKNRKTSKYLPILALILSFRLLKFFYSGYFGMRNF